MQPSNIKGSLTRFHIAMHAASCRRVWQDERGGSEARGSSVSRADDLGEGGAAEEALKATIKQAMESENR